MSLNKLITRPTVPELLKIMHTIKLVIVWPYNLVTEVHFFAHLVEYENACLYIYARVFVHLYTLILGHQTFSLLLNISTLLMTPLKKYK